MDEQIAQGIALLHANAVQQVEDWFMSGPMVNEVLVDYDPPIVERTPNGVVLHQQLRFL